MENMNKSSNVVALGPIKQEKGLYNPLLKGSN